MNKPERISFLMMVVLLILVGWLQLATLLLTALFGYIALRKFSLGHSKLLGLSLFCIVLACIGWGLIHFSARAYREFPKLAEQTIPAVIRFAEEQGITLPFTDYASLKTEVMEELTARFGSMGGYARTVLFQIVYLIIGTVVAISVFFNARLHIEGDPHTTGDNLYTLTARQLAKRFQTFYRSFATVMGAQIVISLINTALTAIFLFSTGFPKPTLISAFTFLCGLLPIIGNIISNTVITAVGFTLSPQMAFFALMFLVVIHKLEYFLNSRIIGHHIKNPMWLTLLGLIIGERLMGIPGLILAPVVLHYIKVEASQNKMKEEQAESSPPSGGGTP
jgi:predicted PurR-regulated permease PerM